jgi:hypothetical protein
MARLSCACRIGGGAGVPIVVFGDGACVAHIEIFGDARVGAVGGCILGGKQQPHQLETFRQGHSVLRPNLAKTAATNSYTPENQRISYATERALDSIQLFGDSAA